MTVKRDSCPRRGLDSRLRMFGNKNLRGMRMGSRKIFTMRNFINSRRFKWAVHEDWVKENRRYFSIFRGTLTNKKEISKKIKNIDERIILN